MGRSFPFREKKSNLDLTRCLNRDNHCSKQEIYAMTIEFDLDQFTERGRKLLLMQANKWGCTPAEALARILDAAAKRAKVTTNGDGITA
jgi:hypothetical protein